MQNAMRPAWRPFLLAGVFAALHLAFVLYFACAVLANPKAAEGAIIVFAYLDYPVHPLSSVGTPFIACLAIGCLLWFCYGFVLQCLFFVRRAGGMWRLSIALLFACLFWSIPEISLRMKPAWEAQWYRAWAIGRGKGTDARKAIGYVTDAIRLSPKDNKELRTLWDYLGELYMDEKDYAGAEFAYQSSLAFTEAQPNPDPRGLLGAYGALSIVYHQSGDKPREKQSLEKMISLCRKVNGGDSKREAGVLENLAQIDHDSGESKEAQALLARAIKMESDVHNADFPFDYWTHKLQKWKAEQ